MSSRPTEIKALAGARAIPPLILVLFHYCEGHGYRGFVWFDLVAAKGYLWVEFFFALSGFILTHVYWERRRDFLSARTWLAFVRTRLIRLYPLHLFMLLAILALLLVLDALARAGGYVSIFHQAYHPVLTWPTFVANLFLVQAWNILPSLSWNGVAWFVSVEFLLCLVFPLYLLAAGRGGLLRGFAIAVLGIAGLIALDLNSRHGLDLTFHSGIWRGMSAFGVGVGLALLFRASADRGVGKASSLIHSAVQLSLVAALLYAIWFTGWSHTHRDIWTVLPMFGLVLALSFDRGLVAEALKTRVPLVLGEWSYAIYIGQTFWLLFVRFAEQRLFPAPDAIVLGWRWADLLWWGEPAGLLLVCIAWGAILSVGVERPVGDALRRRFAHPAPQRTAASS